jgi:hypothetical protein
LNTNSPVDEGSNITLSLAGVTDPSSIDFASLHYAFDCGAGDGFSATDYAGAGTANSASCPTDDNGTRTVKGKVFDKDGGVSTAEVASVTIKNVAPTATFNAPSPVDEGTPIALSLTSPYDPSSADVTAGFEYAFDCGTGSGYGAYGSSNSASCPTTDNGTRDVKGKIKDKDGDFTQYTAQVEIKNVVPIVNAGQDKSGKEGETINLSGTYSDPGTDDTHTWIWEYLEGFHGAAACTITGATTTLTPTITCYDDGTVKVTLAVTDDDAGVGKDEMLLTLSNVAPTATFNAPSQVNEGSAIALSLTSPSDPSSVDVAGGFHYAFDCGDGGGYGTALSYATSGTTSTKSCPTTDNGNRAVKGKIFDKDNGSTEYNASVLVKNVVPVVGPITVIPNVVQVNTPVSLSSPFSDVGTGDTHIGQIDWEGATSSASITEASGAGTATGTHTYTAAGVYTVKLTITDDDGGSGFATYEYVVVYDPSAGFVTGGGWIASPAGACRYAACTYDTQGKATFGFVSKYITQGKDKTLLLTGNTEFQFQAGNLNFKSIDYEWLVVNGGSGRAQYKGTGTVNGGGNFGFILTAYDGSTDKFRIKIWEVSSGTVVYDNKMGLADTTNDATVLGGGSIIIHVPKGVS